MKFIFQDCQDLIKSEPHSSRREDFPSHHHHNPSPLDYHHHPRHSGPHDIPDEFREGGDYADTGDYDTGGNMPVAVSTGSGDFDPLSVCYYDTTTLVGGAAVTTIGVVDPLGPDDEHHQHHQHPHQQQQVVDPGYVQYTINYNTQTYHRPSTPTLVSSVTVAQSPLGLDDYPATPSAIAATVGVPRTINSNGGSGGRGAVELVTRATPPPPYNQSFSSPSPSSTSTLSSSPHQELSTPVKYNRYR